MVKQDISKHPLLFKFFWFYLKEKLGCEYAYRNNKRNKGNPFEELPS